MIDNHLNIIGTGGHAKVVLDIAMQSNQVIDAFYDDSSKSNKTNFNGFNVLSPIDKLTDGNAIVAIGNNKIRKEISNRFNNINWKTLIQTGTIISDNVVIRGGSLIVAGAILQTCTIIGEHCIINTNASIDHDCIIDNFVHISPSVTLCGNVKIGEGTHVGAGATIIPNTKIGKWCVIGAGAVVTKDVPDFSLVVGVPGKIIKTLKDE
jgi:sugar O-acyltransferase (sialic acid O-acetyltransferase NeuD family)